MSRVRIRLRLRVMWIHRSQELPGNTSEEGSARPFTAMTDRQAVIGRRSLIAAQGGATLSGGSASQADFNLGDRELVFLPIVS